MNRIHPATIGLTLALGLSTPAMTWAEISSTQLSQYAESNCDEGDESCSEIAAYSAAASRVYVTNAAKNELRILDIDGDGMLTEFASIDLSDYGGGPNSVATYGDWVAVAVEADTKTDNGSVVVFDPAGENPMVLPAGALPDMLTFSPDGKYLVVANEGEPNDDYDVDPEGSISVIDTQTWSVATAGFALYNDAKLKDVRIFGPNASVAQDLEPEYVAISADSTTAWVSLQENNALAKVDLASATVTDIYGLGFKKHHQSKNGFDASDKDDGINIKAQPTKGMYMPDAIAAFQRDDATFILSANEGDARDYDGYSEEARVKDLVLDPKKFPNAEELQQDENLGRLKTTTSMGDTDGDGDVDEIYSYGARSFSIWNGNGTQVYDSGSEFEHFLAQYADAGMDVWEDGRSDDKGPEPESITTGELGGDLYAFIGLERTSGIFIYQISNPNKPQAAGFMDVEALGNEGPEGLLFVPKTDTTGWLIVTNEISNSVSVYEISLN